MKKQIIFSHLYNDYSGSPRVLLSVIRALSSQYECRLHLGNLDGGILSSVNIPITQFFYRRHDYKILTLLFYLVSQISLFINLLRDDNIREDAIVYVNTLLPFGALLWGKLFKHTVILHVHEISIKPRLLRRFLIKIAEVSADEVIWVSETHREMLPINCCRKTVLYNCLDEKTNSIAKRHEVKSNMKNNKTFNILMLASHREYKGITEFILLSNRFQNRTEIKFHLVLNENNQFVANYKKNIRSFESNIQVWKQTALPQKHYLRANLILNLSRVDQWIETFGLTILEGLSFSLPVIAPPVGGCTELVRDGKEGFLIDSRDTDELENKVNLLISNQKLYKKLAENAKLRSDFFSSERFIQRINSIISTHSSK